MFSFYVDHPRNDGPRRHIGRSRENKYSDSVLRTFLRLPDINVSMRKGGGAIVSLRPRIGKLGEMILEMLPKDLVFTVFFPSEKAFERDLRLIVNVSLVAEKVNDTYEILTRILGCSLYIWKELDGMLVVNRVRSERVDLKKGQIILHIMNGVTMDKEFEQSVQPDDNEEE
ncbi:unnamed protein product [Ilex paraguariensis]|uniref:Uncharacterized protein n=1 Tax=Ilex paraguariensis TaxID=185542 RepID=A0ABC8TWU9_9AQUA